MKLKTLIAALAVLFLSSACAAGQMDDQSQTGASGSPEAQSTEPGTVTPSVGGEAPVTEHQSEAIRGVEQRFQELDKDGDGLISRDEAESMPALADYWQKQEMGDDDTLDQAEFAQFESEMETGVDMYDSESKEGPGGVPATPHQREVTGEGEGGAESGGAQQ